MAKREFMTGIITKYLITAAIIVVASEIAKRSDKLGTIVVALPIVTIMAMIWLYLKNESNEKL
jgi:F0F1-type ATP synthase assembly protein I